MTRETLKAEYYNRITDAPSLSKMELAELVCEQLDLIFDKLENRTCRNCSYCSYSTGKKNEHQLICSLKISSDKFFGSDCVTGDFGCNNWEAKDDK